MKKKKNTRVPLTEGDRVLDGRTIVRAKYEPWAFPGVVLRFYEIPERSVDSV